MMFFIIFSIYDLFSVFCRGAGGTSIITGNGVARAKTCAGIFINTHASLSKFKMPCTDIHVIFARRPIKLSYMSAIYLDWYDGCTRDHLFCAIFHSV
jgi:hypothetical protein